MDLARADAMLFYDDFEPESQSPSHLEGSEDEDTQQELEEMLYSRVYHDSSSIDLPPSLPENCPILNVNITPIEDPAAKLECRTNEHSISSALESPKNCARSEFNHPSRKSASRYYDVNQEVHNARPTFIAPTNPSKSSNSKKVIKRKQNNSVLSNEFLARSPNEQSYLPKATPVVKNSTVPPQNVSKAEDLLFKITEQKKRESVAANSEQSLIMSVSSLEPTATENKQTETPTVTHLNQNEDRISDTSEDVQLKKGLQSTPIRESIKRNQRQQQTFEAKVSKVLSSMLDEESRSSVEETQLTSLSSAQELNSDSGWSVGMSWADMSSKYSFGVDSIEEESVSSLQLHDTSFTADSRTNTPDLQTQHINNDDSKADENEPEEPSRYAMQLKDHSDDANKESHANPCDTDSESEVGSIVEVAPPVKPPPVLVDISDSEFVPAEHSSEVVEHVIDSSDDDILVLDVIDISKTKNKSRSPQKGHKRQSNTQFDGSPCAEDIIPIKRSSHHYHQDIISVEEEELVEEQKFDRETLLPGPLTVKKMDRLERWLYNPIKASKYLDHEKHLAKMSNNPSLWRLCRGDVMKVQSPRGPKCTNCNEFGHKTHLCRKPRKIISCHMCGQPGHTETRCKEKMCLRCAKKNHIFTDRCRGCTNNSVLCKICKARTHAWKTCPDLWRRYHLTTSAGNITQPTGGDDRPRSEQWCSNCARRGHLSHDCHAPHWKCESISPFIQSYANVDVEETQFEGAQMFSLMLTDDAASALNTEEGKELLKSLSEECQVEIHTSLDITYKKLSMKGSTLAMEEVRSRVMKWTSPKEVASRIESLPIEVPPKITGEAPSQNVSDISTKNASMASNNNVSEASTKNLSEASTKNLNEASSINASEASTKNISKASTNNAILPAERPSKETAETPEKSDFLCNILNHEVSSTSSSIRVEKSKTPTTKQKTSKGASLITNTESKSGDARMTICDVWDLPPSLPKHHVALRIHLEREMKYLDSHVYCNKTVRQIYELYLKASKARKKDARHYSRILTIILLGKCGFGDGPNHVDALRKLIQDLNENKEGNRSLREEAAKHYIPIFQGRERNDFQSLVDQFYSNESLVKMFDGGTHGNQCVSDSNRKGRGSSCSEENNCSSIDKSEIHHTPPKKKMKKLPRTPLHPYNNLKAEEKRIKKIVPLVVKNLNSRFIYSHDRTSLEKMYASFFKLKASKKKEIIAGINQVIDKLCKSYNIKLPT